MTKVFSGKTLLSFDLLHFVLQGQICLLLQVSLDFLLLHSSPIGDIILGCQFQKVLQVFIEPFNFSFFSVTGQDIDLYYCDTDMPLQLWTLLSPADTSNVECHFRFDPVSSFFLELFLSSLPQQHWTCTNFGAHLPVPYIFAFLYFS